MVNPHRSHDQSSNSRIRSVALGGAFAALSFLSSASCFADPVITGVSEISAQQTQTITITGSDFGTMSPYSGDSASIALTDLTAGWQAGNAPDGNVVTLDVLSWTDTSIVLGGFGSAYGDYNWTLTNGDQEEVQIWNAQTGSGPASYDVTVGSAATPEPSSLLLLGSGLISFAGMMRRKLKA
jgi:hypothetical protein